jgi:hypothetical protein
VVPGDEHFAKAQAELITDCHLDLLGARRRRASQGPGDGSGALPFMQAGFDVVGGGDKVVVVVGPGGGIPQLERGR